MTTKKIIGIVIIVLLLAGFALKWNTIRWAYYGVRILRAKRYSLPALEQQGKPYRPAHQILYETEWLCGATHDYQHMGKQTNILEDALRDTANADAIDEQSVIDGSWGRCGTQNGFSN